jgi:hypothetical protein
MAIVKHDDQSVPVHPPTRALASSPTISISLDNEMSPDLELSPRFRAILDDVVHAQPEVVKARYDEFRDVERRAANSPMQNANQVRLYFAPVFKILTDVGRGSISHYGLKDI